MVVGGLIVMLAGYGIHRYSTHRLSSPVSPAALARVSYWFGGAHSGLAGPIQARIKAAGYEPVMVGSAAEADLVVSQTAQPGATPIQFAGAGQPAKLISGSLLAPAATAGAYLSVSNRHHLPATALANLKTQLAADLHAAPSNQWTLKAVGDIIIGRTVYLQMQRYGMLHPFDLFADTLRTADLTLADLECTISDAKTIVTRSGMTFASPFASAAGLEASGIDAVNVANNHSFNVGASGFTDTLDAMKRLNIGTFGGGHNDAEAHTPLIVTTHGIKIALLGYSSIAGSQPASDTTPGMAHLTMAPWGSFNEAEAHRMEGDIRAAKAKADVVMVYYHWGTEYTHDANADQRTIAHRAVDAGADLILGTHPHWVQGVEWYKDRLITYSLGNFVFDQEWSIKTKQGVMLKATFDGAKLTAAELVPYQIEDYQQPRPADAATGRQILEDVYTHSWWPTQ